MTDSTPDGLNENAQKTLAKAWRTVVSLLTCRKPLLVTVIINVIFGAGVLLFALFIWKSFLGISGDKSCFTTPLLSGLCTSISPSTDKDILATLVSAVLPTVAGAAGIVYLTIAYRKRQQEEREEERVEIAGLEEKFIKSVEFLSKSSAMEHIAGLHSLASIADSRPDIFRQRVVHTICSFIRTAKLRINEMGDGTMEKEIEISQASAIEIIREHTAESMVEQSWSDCVFHLQEAVFYCPVHIEKCNFNERIELWGSTFRRAVYCSESRFKDININGSRFEGARIDLRSTNYGQIHLNGKIFISGTVIHDPTTPTPKNIFATDSSFESPALIPAEGNPELKQLNEHSDGEVSDPKEYPAVLFLGSRFKLEPGIQEITKVENLSAEEKFSWTKSKPKKSFEYDSILTQIPESAHLIIIGRESIHDHDD